ncbi:hypothetical protein BJF78_19565 [Pseudonocardia sp. CNS-139]|nr:hypothetical protein BJF78_19565 [Pseudonocardia sp. CNS-139]
MRVDDLLGRLGELPDGGVLAARVNTSPPTSSFGDARSRWKRSHTSAMWICGRCCSPPSTVTARSTWATAASWLTITSNRHRGDQPHSVASRMLTVARSGELNDRTIGSLSALHLLYSRRQLSGSSSVMFGVTLMPYTENEEQLTKRRAPPSRVASRRAG